MLPDKYTAAESTRVESPPVDQAVLDDLVAELGEPDGEFLAELITSYLEEGAANAQNLTAAADRQDGATVAAIAHAWRSTSALIGATELVSLLLRAEAVAQESPSALSALGVPIAHEYERVAAWLSRL
jgi:HPt (histidine-containing phosphotransfer) domain-containing protein